VGHDLDQASPDTAVCLPAPGRRGLALRMTDPDSRSIATSGRGAGVVGYNVQAVVAAKHHLIVARDVIKVGSDGAGALMTARRA
jgi:hypothetical protein